MIKWIYKKSHIQNEWDFFYIRVSPSIIQRFPVTLHGMQPPAFFSYQKFHAILWQSKADPVVISGQRWKLLLQPYPFFCGNNRPNPIANTMNEIEFTHFFFSSLDNNFTMHRNWYGSWVPGTPSKSHPQGLVRVYYAPPKYN